MRRIDQPATLRAIAKQRPLDRPPGVIGCSRLDCRQLLFERSIPRYRVVLRRRVNGQEVLECVHLVVRGVAVRLHAIHVLQQRGELLRPVGIPGSVAGLLPQPRHLFEQVLQLLLGCRRAVVARRQAAQVDAVGAAQAEEPLVAVDALLVFERDVGGVDPELQAVAEQVRSGEPQRLSRPAVRRLVGALAGHHQVVDPARAHRCAGFLRVGAVDPARQRAAVAKAVLHPVRGVVSVQPVHVVCRQRDRGQWLADGRALALPVLDRFARAVLVVVPVMDDLVELPQVDQLRLLECTVDPDFAALRNRRETVAEILQSLLDTRHVEQPVVAPGVATDRPVERELVVARVVQRPVAEEGRTGGAVVVDYPQLQAESVVRLAAVEAGEVDRDLSGFQRLALAQALDVQGRYEENDAARTQGLLAGVAADRLQPLVTAPARCFDRLHAVLALGRQEMPLAVAQEDGGAADLDV
ncbi:MAG: hypothetical protein AW07_04167 [Candidatus Accumulibacter sp. SK-11]|nr:MAG: hypothetical protein AW07_04167 [Candidatus Accumulibacter sp. SK-11]